jgi:NNP family nitrate/nitrite transporter-like MFS transporter
VSEKPAGPKLPTIVLFVNTFSFAICFAAWVMLGPSSKAIAAELHLSQAQAIFLKSLPVLLGAVMRIPIGILTDRLGARRTMPLMMFIGSLSALALSYSTTWLSLVCGCLILGMVGTSFTVGVQSVSSWTAKSLQGVALGIFGSGNAGTALTTLFLPFMLTGMGWRGAFRVYSGVLFVVAAAYFLIVRDVRLPPSGKGIASLLAPLAQPKTWLFGLYYIATFGAFVGLTLTISDVYVDAYRMTLKQAGMLATTFTLFASLARILGGKLSDRFGPGPVLRGSLATVVLALLPVLAGPSVLLTGGMIFISGLAMGIGMAATFKYVAQHFPSSVGAVGGVVGALGGVGGFLLPFLDASVKHSSGSLFLQFLPILLVAGVGLVLQITIPLRESAIVVPLIPVGSAGDSLVSLSWALNVSGAKLAPQVETINDRESLPREVNRH